MTVSIPSLAPEASGDVIRRIHFLLRGSVFGYLERNVIYFLGDPNELEIGLRDIDTPSGELECALVEDGTLEPQNGQQRRAIQKILYSGLEAFLEVKGFIKGRGRIAIPTPNLQRQVDFPLIHGNQLFESFQYSFHVTPTRDLLLQIDPTVSVVIPFTGSQNDWAVPACFDEECPHTGRCPALPRHTVRFLRYDNGGMTSQCPRTSSPFAVVYDPKTNSELALPRGCLFEEGRPGRIDFTKVRSLSVKDPSDRRRLTERFIDLLSTNGQIRIDLRGEEVDFPTTPVESARSSSIEISPYRTYSVIDEPKVMFGENITAIDPYRALDQYGTFSANASSEERYYVQRMRVFAVFPEPFRQEVLNCIERLSKGYGRYRGFHAEVNPYRLAMSLVEVPIQIPQASYVQAVRTRMENLLQRHSVGPGDVFLVVLRQDEDYYPLKELFISLGLRSQMIRRSSLSLDWYPLFNFSLSMYAKAGGTPWRLPPGYLDIADCYLGMAIKVSKKDRFSPPDFYVGAVDVFNAHGEHLSIALRYGMPERAVRGLHVDEPFMKDLVSKAVARYRDEEGNLPNVLCIHRQAPFIGEEIDGVSDVLSGKGIDTAYLVHVEHNSGFRAYDSSLDDQVFRGTAVRTGPASVLLFPTGWLPVSNTPQKLGTPRPAHLRVLTLTHEGRRDTLTSEELLGICQSYLAFTRLRWNTLGIRIRNPLTLFAADRVGEWAKQGFKQLERLDIRDVL